MRVTHVITRLIVGGAQENTIATVLGLRRKPGIEVRLASGPTGGPEGSLEPAVRHYPGLFTLVPSLVRPVHPWKDVLAWRALIHEFRRNPPEVVHTHSGKAGILGRWAAAHCRVPVVIHSIHGPSFGTFQGAAANWMFRSAERAAARHTTHFIVVAEAMRDQYVAAGIGRPDQYTRIFSGFRLDPFLSANRNSEIRKRFGIAEDEIVVGKIARLFPLKGHEDLMEAATRLIEQCPKVKFLFVGDGIWRARFEEWANRPGLKGHFVFTGLVPPDQVPELVGAMDVLVHLSRREGLARALPQAMAAGKPVVAFDCDGAREVCLDGRTGFLVPTGDTDLMASRLLELLHSPELRNELGRRGQELVRGQFSEEMMVEQILALYRRLSPK